MYHRPRTVFAHEKGLGDWPLVEEEARSATNHITNNTSHNLNFKDASSTGVDAHIDYTEEEFVRKSLQNLADAGEVKDGDHVIIGHGYWDYGYGGGEVHDQFNGLDLHGVAVYSGAYVNDRESRAFVWHELGHIMGAGHQEGCYNISYDSNHDEYMNFDITPMATGYVYDDNDENDTQFSTSGYHGFDSFDCDRQSPSLYTNDYDDFDDHHVYPYSNESIQLIENTIDS